MTTILGSLIATAWPYIAALAGVLLYGLYQRRQGAASERNANRAKEADAYEKHLQDIAAAADARNRVRPDGVVSDPYNRDNAR